MVDSHHEVTMILLCLGSRGAVMGREWYSQSDGLHLEVTTGFPAKSKMLIHVY